MHAVLTLCRLRADVAVDHVPQHLLRGALAGVAISATARQRQLDAGVEGKGHELLGRRPLAGGQTEDADRSGLTAGQAVAWVAGSLDESGDGPGAVATIGDLDLLAEPA